MSRVKTFDATGIPPGGRLFAGDLNSIQDKYADAANFAQTVDLATLRVGDTGIQLVKYGTGEARITASLRTDGILRGLGGLFAGAFTTAQRDAIAAGSRPFTVIIFNTTLGRFEYNAGTDAAPNWQPIIDANAGVAIGSTMDWPWRSNEMPSNFLLPYGQAVSRTTYAALHALAAAAGYPWGNGDGSTTFNLPDYRGRVGIGKDDMGGAAAGRVTAGGSGINGATLGANGGVQTVALATGELPVHAHGSTALTITGSASLSGSVNNGSLAATVGSLALPNHGHNYTDPGHSHTVTARNAGANAPDWLDSYFHDEGDPGVTASGVNSNTTGITIGNPTSLPAVTGAPGLSGAVSNGTLAVTNNTLDVGGTTDNAGSGTGHNNMMPSIIVNKIMRAL